jgi:16S rRNA (adenine1518-N6/adenine1519-N6)-dimethyltransferase
MQYTLKKSLGQHFLKDENICKKIVDVVDANLANHAVHQLVEVGLVAELLQNICCNCPI